ncbi:MAG: hypothetical protein HQK75_03020 [Candidatus Magnetomorum sp.]|nr:hypothetical protein [Candidatus Magnetomorum sp.]
MNIIKHSDIQAPSIVEKKLTALKHLRKELVGLSPEEALDRIISCEQPIALVHSIPAQDFLMLVHDIGPEDALPILSLASTKQWQYMIDVQVWKRDRLCISETTKWLHLMMKAEPNRFIHWFLNEDPKFFYYYLYQNIDIVGLQEDEDFSDLPDTFFSLDNIYYISLSDARLEQPLERETEELREELITEFLKRLAAYDHYEYQKVLVNISSVLAAEFEEESFRLKNSQLESYGFLSFDDAIAIYQPIPEKHFFKGKRKPVVASKTATPQMVGPQYPIQMISRDNYFAEALMLMDSEESLSELHVHFAHLCNQIISADAISISSQDTLKQVVNKACGYIHIAIESLLAENAPNPVSLKQIVLNYPIKELFQWGYSKVLAVKWKADSWYRNSFFKEHGLKLDFWGEKWFGILGGLLLKRPRYFAEFEKGQLYREFQKMSDIQTVENALTQMIAIDEMISIFSANIHPISGYQLTFQNLLLTLFARDSLSLSPTLEPIPVTQFQKFYESMWISDPPHNSIQTAFKQSFIDWFSKQTRFDTNYLDHRIGSVLDQLFDDILAELGNVPFHSLSPQYVNLFWLTSSV